MTEPAKRSPPYEEPLIAEEDSHELNGDEPHDIYETKHEDMPIITEGDDDVHSPAMANVEGHASMTSTTINMMCNVIGGGVLALPTAFHHSSLVVGIVLLFLVAGITTSNLYFIVQCAHHTRIYSYRLLLIFGLGRIPAKLVDIALFIFPFGALVAYCAVVADAMPPVMANFIGASGFWLNPICWLIIGGVLFFLLSCRRSLNELKITSIFGLLTIFYLVILVVVRFFDGRYGAFHKPAEVSEDFRAIYLNSNILRTIPLIAFAFSVHNNAPTYYEELQDRTPEKMMTVIKVSHAGIITTYLLMAIFGLLTFGDSITLADGDILKRYSEDDTLINTARICMFVHFACVYPILQMAARRGFNNLVFKTNSLPLWQLCVESFFIVVASALIAGAVPNIDVVLSINGALFGSIIVMIAPSVLYLRVDPFNVAARGGWLVSRGIAWVSVVTGFVVGTIGVTVTIIDVVKHGGN